MANENANTQKQNKAKDTKQEKAKTPAQDKITRVKLIRPVLIKGGKKEDLVKEVEALYKKHNFKTDDGCVLRHMMNIMRDIKNQRKGWWASYKDVSKDDTIKITSQ